MGFAWVFWDIFRWVVTVIGAAYKVYIYIPSRSRIEALYTLNSPPVVSFKVWMDFEWVWVGFASAIQGEPCRLGEGPVI